MGPEVQATFKLQPSYQCHAWTKWTANKVWIQLFLIGFASHTLKQKITQNRYPYINPLVSLMVFEPNLLHGFTSFMSVLLWHYWIFHQKKDPFNVRPVLGWWWSQGSGKAAVGPGVNSQLVQMALFASNRHTPQTYGTHVSIVHVVGNVEFPRSQPHFHRSFNLCLELRLDLRVHPIHPDPQKVVRKCRNFEGDDLNTLWRFHGSYPQQKRVRLLSSRLQPCRGLSLYIFAARRFLQTPFRWT